MAETYPPEISTFEVIGRLVKWIADSDDEGRDPDVQPIVGAQITFTPDLNPPIFRIPGGSTPTTVFAETIKATTDEDGYLIIDGESERGVILAWGMDENIVPNGWSWRVVINVGGNFPARVFSIVGEADGTVDLANVIPVPPSPGTEIAQWVQVLNQIDEAKSIVLGAAEEISEVTGPGGPLSRAELTARVAEDVGSLVPPAVETSIANADIPGKVTSAITNADIPGLVGTQVTDQVDPQVVAAQTARTEAEAARDLALAGQFAGATLGVENLDTVTTPGAYYQPVSSTSTVERGYPLPGYGGLLEVFRTTSIVRIQRFTIVTGSGSAHMRGIYERRFTGSAWEVWRFIPTQRIDQTAGRAIYTWDDANNREQLIYGDTGVRSLQTQNTSSLGAFRIRRLGSIVELTLVAAVSSASGDVNLLAEQLPTGFRPNNTRSFAAVKGTTLAMATLAHDGSTLVVSGSAVGSPWSLALLYSTQDTWPTTLPGTAVGSIPAS